VIFLLPACGEKVASGVGREPDEGAFWNAQARGYAPSPDFASLRSQIDLSPHAGRGVMKPVLARDDSKRRKRVEAAE
jgi:hypothetical protein